MTITELLDQLEHHSADVKVAFDSKNALNFKVSHEDLELPGAVPYQVSVRYHGQWSNRSDHRSTQDDVTDGRVDRFMVNGVTNWAQIRRYSDRSITGISGRSLRPTLSD